MVLPPSQSTVADMPQHEEKQNEDMPKYVHESMLSSMQLRNIMQRQQIYPMAFEKIEQYTQVNLATLIATATTESQLQLQQQIFPSPHLSLYKSPLKKKRNLLACNPLDIEPDYHFSQEQIDFGVVTFGHFYQKTVTLFNDSGHELSFTLIASSNEDNIYRKDFAIVVEIPDNECIRLASIDAQLISIPPHSNAIITIEFVPSYEGQYEHFSLRLHVEDDKDKKTTNTLTHLPIFAKSIVVLPKIETTEYDLGNIFLQHLIKVPVSCVNENALHAKIICGEHSFPNLIEINPHVPSVTLAPKNNFDFIFHITPKQLGTHATVFFLSVPGSPLQHKLTFKYNCHGPILKLDAQAISFGSLQCLVAKTRTLKLTNDSPITATINCSTKQSRSCYALSPSKMILPPHSSTDLLVTATLNDNLPIRDTLQIHIENADDIHIPLSADGVGKTIESDIESQMKVMNIGYHFTHFTATRHFTLTNKGRRVQVLNWERVIDPSGKDKSIHESKSPQRKKDKQDEDEEEDIPEYTLTPLKCTLTSGQSMTFTLTVQKPRPQTVRETWICSSFIGTNRRSEPVYESLFVTSFITPKLTLSSTNLSFVHYQNSSDEEVDKYYEKYLTLTNNTPLPFSFELRSGSPFSLPSIANKTSLRLEPNGSMNLPVVFLFSPNAYNKQSSIKVDNVLITYAQHPSKQNIALHAAVHYPNLSFSASRVETQDSQKSTSVPVTPSYDIDFGCIEQEIYTKITHTVSNSSALPVQYKWTISPHLVATSFTAIKSSTSKTGSSSPNNRLILTEDVTESTIPIDEVGDVNEVFDILPIFGQLNPNESEEVTFVFNSTDLPTILQAAAFCEVLGGPRYEFRLHASSASLTYYLSKTAVSFGAVLVGESKQKKISLRNNGKVPFNYFTESLQLPPEVLSVHPSSGKLGAGERVILILTLNCSMPEAIDADIKLAVAHLEPSIIHISGLGVFPQLYSSLPRKPWDSIEMEEIYNECLLEAEDTITESLKIENQLAAEANTVINSINGGSSTVLFTASVDENQNHLVRTMDLLEPQQRSPQATCESIRRLLIPSPLKTAQSMTSIMSTPNRSFHVPEMPDSFYQTYPFAKVELEATRLFYCRLLKHNANSSAEHKWPFLQAIDCSFEAIKLGSTVSQNITLTNTSGLPVHLSIDKSKLDGTPFSIEPKTLHIDPGASSTLLATCVTAKPKKKKVPVAEEGYNSMILPLSIQNGPTLALNLSYDAVIPDLTLSTTSCEFGSVMRGTMAEMYMLLSNEKSVLAQFSFGAPSALNSADANCFHFSPMSGTLPVRGSVRVQVVYFPPTLLQNVDPIGKTVRAKITLKVGRKHKLINLSATPIAPCLSFHPSSISFPPMHPHEFSQPIQVWLRNDSAVAVEVYSAEFDAQVRQEAAILQTEIAFGQAETLAKLNRDDNLRRARPNSLYETEGVVVMEHRNPGESLPSIVLKRNRCHLSEGRSTSCNLPLICGMPLLTGVTGLLDITTPLVVNILVLGPPLSGCTSISQLLKSHYNLEESAILTIDGAVQFFYNLACEHEKEIAEREQRKRQEELQHEKEKKGKSKAIEKQELPLKEEGVQEDLCLISSLYSEAELDVAHTVKEAIDVYRELRLQERKAAAMASVSSPQKDKKTKGKESSIGTDPVLEAIQRDSFHDIGMLALTSPTAPPLSFDLLVSLLRYYILQKQFSNGLIIDGLQSSFLPIPAAAALITHVFASLSMDRDSDLLVCLLDIDRQAVLDRIQLVKEGLQSEYAKVNTSEVLEWKPATDKEMEKWNEDKRNKYKVISDNVIHKLIIEKEMWKLENISRWQSDIYFNPDANVLEAILSTFEIKKGANGKSFSERQTEENALYQLSKPSSLRWIKLAKINATVPVDEVLTSTLAFLSEPFFSAMDEQLHTIQSYDVVKKPMQDDHSNSGLADSMVLIDWELIEKWKESSNAKRRARVERADEDEELGEAQFVLKERGGSGPSIVATLSSRAITQPSSPTGSPLPTKILANLLKTAQPSRSRWILPPHSSTPLFFSFGSRAELVSLQSQLRFFVVGNSQHAFVLPFETIVSEPDIIRDPVFLFPSAASKKKPKKNTTKEPNVTLTADQKQLIHTGWSKKANRYDFGSILCGRGPDPNFNSVTTSRTKLLADPNHGLLRLSNNSAYPVHAALSMLKETTSQIQADIATISSTPTNGKKKPPVKGKEEVGKNVKGKPTFKGDKLKGNIPSTKQDELVSNCVFSVSHSVVEIPVGKSVDVSLSAFAYNPGEFSDILCITIENSALPLLLPMRCISQAPKLTLSATTIGFNRLLVGQLRTEYITVNNPYAIPCNVSCSIGDGKEGTASDPDGQLQIVGNSSRSLAPFTSAKFGLKFAPTGPTKLNTKVNFRLIAFDKSVGILDELSVPVDSESIDLNIKTSLEDLPNGLEYGNIRVNYPVDKKITVTNRSNFPVDYSFVINGENESYLSSILQFYPPKGRIDPLNACDLIVQCKPNREFQLTSTEDVRLKLIQRTEENGQANPAFPAKAKLLSVPVSFNAVYSHFSIEEIIYANDVELPDNNANATPHAPKDPKTTKNTTKNSKSEPVVDESNLTYRKVLDSTQVQVPSFEFDFGNMIPRHMKKRSFRIKNSGLLPFKWRVYSVTDENEFSYRKYKEELENELKEKEIVAADPKLNDKKKPGNTKPDFAAGSKGKKVVVVERSFNVDNFSLSSFEGEIPPQAEETIEILYRSVNDILKKSTRFQLEIEGIDESIVRKQSSVVEEDEQDAGLNTSTDPSVTPSFIEFYGTVNVCYPRILTSDYLSIFSPFSDIRPRTFMRSERNRRSMFAFEDKVYCFAKVKIFVTELDKDKNHDKKNAKKKPNTVSNSAPDKGKSNLPVVDYTRTEQFRITNASPVPVKVRLCLASNPAIPNWITAGFAQNEANQLSTGPATGKAAAPKKEDLKKPDPAEITCGLFALSNGELNLPPHASELFSMSFSPQTEVKSNCYFFAYCQGAENASSGLLSFEVQAEAIETVKTEIVNLNLS